MLIAFLGCARKSGDLLGIPELHLTDLEGKTVKALPPTGPEAAVFIFVGADCPISNLYAPEILRLRERNSRDAFWIVYPGTRFSVEQQRTHLADHFQGCAALRDPEFRLAKASQVKITPEAAVFTAAKGLVYHGRIDDRFVDFGVQRPAPTRRDLQAALDAVARGMEPPVPSAPAVGCPLAN